MGGELRSGGSLALEGLLADSEVCAAVYAALLQHFHFDLVKWLRYEQPSPVSAIRALIEQLPEGNLYTAIMSAPGDGAAEQEAEEPDPEREALIERATWTFDRKQMAQLINVMQFIAVNLHPWEKGQAPKFDPAGPSSWFEKEEPKKRVTGNDVIALLSMIQPQGAS